MNSGDFWQSIKEDWHSVSPTVDVPKLRRQVERKRRRMLAFQILDTVVTLVFTGMVATVGLPAAMRIGHVESWLLVVAAWIVLLASGWMRFSTWKTDGLDAVGLLRVDLRRARGGMYFVWFNIVAVPVAYTLFVPAYWHIWSTGNETQQHHLLLGICFNIAFYLVIVGWAIWYGRRQRRKIRRAKYLLRQLEQENESPDEHL